MQLGCNKVTRLFGKSYIPLAIVIMVMISVVYYIDDKSRSDLLKSEEFQIIQQQEKIILHEVEHVTTDLRVLSNNYFLKQYHRGDKLDILPVEYEFLVLIKEKEEYDQIRFIAADGREKVRVNRNAGQVYVTPESQLQNKSERYYFKNTIQLNQGEMFISPFDLNIENGRIELPVKSVLRFAMPVFNSSGVKIGIVIINYTGSDILELLNGLGENKIGITLLLNRNSYYLRGFSPDDEWGFMFPGKEDVNFKAEFPVAWRKILSKKQGQFIDNDGLFTYSIIYPLSDGVHYHTGMSETRKTGAVQHATHDFFWVLISYVTPVKLKSRGWVLYLVSGAFMLVILGFYSWKTAQANCQRIEAEKELEQQATHDDLTHLPNRKLLYDRLEQTLAQAERQKFPFALFFIDLDNFKPVNDTYGHEAGDIVLQQTALRMQRVLRKSDTLARVGGDEFVVLIPDIGDVDDLDIIAKKLISVVNAPVLIKSDRGVIDQFIGASIGISLYPENGRDADILMNAADKAMYKAKQSGRNRFYQAG
ncbi:sensor domain-containing diguanylate cyclase [Vibrio salinus]|uniref:sensor domain-containing diguanylate cyclase n=1 Tax=Vibrio salinus TaxID=2899784 RepID=UPI001E40EBA9|nr:sensor domain-containing diguanylate cyclase [Vibrio salinus]MCE0494644.1 sensor domain-containing diguanylate cyclase [Vibrio salinus]